MERQTGPGSHLDADLFGTTTAMVALAVASIKLSELSGPSPTGSRDLVARADGQATAGSR
jgi:hypothetical protein